MFSSAVFPENVANGLVGNHVAEIVPSSLDLVITPEWVLVGETKNEFDDFLRRFRVS